MDDVKNISLCDALTNMLHPTLHHALPRFVSSTHLQGHHDMVFRTTESDLRRLLKGAEKASNQDLEALEVLRGSERFLKGCTDDKDCNKHGKCDIKQNDTEGDCKCDKGYEGKSCDQREFEVTVLVTNVPNTKSADCQEALEVLENVKFPKTMPADKSKGKHSRDRRLKSSKGPLVFTVTLDASRSCITRNTDGNGLLDQLEAELPKGIKIKNTGGSRDM
jgi:hypothetical protein